MTEHQEFGDRRPTIRDVAERAGVSKSLVSLVMRGEPMVAVPDDLALTGYDDTFVAASRPIALTSVDPNSSAIGTLAAQCLLDRIATPEAPLREHLLPPRLVARSSSGSRAGPRTGSCGAWSVRVS